MDADQVRINELSECIIGCSFQVLNTLEAGFLEKNYENALAHELRKSGLTVAQQRGITVNYDGIVIGSYAVDLLVEETIIVELKTVKSFDPIHIAQCLNYLKATRRQPSHFRATRRGRRCPGPRHVSAQSLVDAGPPAASPEPISVEHIPIQPRRLVNVPDWLLRPSTTSVESFRRRRRYSGQNRTTLQSRILNP